MDTSELKQLILQTVASIPRGKVASYGQVARLCGYPGYARYVGSVLKQLPKNTALPWHRVINARGEISLRELEDLQRALLEDEGVEFDRRGRVDLERFGWKPRTRTRS